MQTYRLKKTLHTAPVTVAARQAIERSMLDVYCCPGCGEDREPFLDYFDLSLEIECVTCERSGRLADFIAND